VRALVVVLGSLALVPSAYGWTDSGRQLSLDWPAEGRLNSPYGRDGYRQHSGLDIGVLRSLDVQAAEDGVVTRVGWIPGYDGYGMIVEVQLNERYSTLYAHLSKATVRVGQKVTTCQRLGLAGCTGSCTGTHLHFELRDHEVPIDPMPLITGYNSAF
jgi:murein DD-endopeptidase MepM/ murein hydrolase activator NlpD